MVNYRVIGAENGKAKKLSGDTVIAFEKVSKTYTLYKNDKQRLLGLFFKKLIKSKSFLALDELTVDVKKGECLGILGKNGAGKSTMLKILTGVTFPSGGTVAIKGQVSALLELTAGFDPEMTGRENIYLRAYLMGLNKHKIAALEEDIIAFSELGDFIDQPLRTYSSGMKARLGFAVNANVDPDILVIDEALSVGDATFAKKCKKKVDEIIKNGATVLFVSHQLDAVRDFCTRCIVLNQGHLMYSGDVESSIELYKAKYI